MNEIYDGELKHGDIVLIHSDELCCGMDKTSFTALLVESKKNGLIAIPQDFYGYIERCKRSGVGCELEVDYILENCSEITVIRKGD